MEKKLQIPYLTYFIDLQNQIRFYFTKFIDSTRFMASSLSILVNNLAEEILKTKCKNCETCRIK